MKWNPRAPMQCRILRAFSKKCQFQILKPQGTLTSFLGVSSNGTKTDIAWGCGEPGQLELIDETVRYRKWDDGVASLWGFMNFYWAKRLTFVCKAGYQRSVFSPQCLLINLQHCGSIRRCIVYVPDQSFLTHLQPFLKTWIFPQQRPRKVGNAS